MTNKKNQFRRSLLLIFVFVFLLSTLAFAIPNSLTIQGKLTNTAGTSQQGTFNFTFRIYDAAAGGNELWASANQSVTTDVNGIYDVILTGLNLSFADQYYLGIAVQSENESAPRINLTSAPYSFRANTSEALNPNASYFVRNISIAGHATIGNGTSLIEISTQRFNVSTAGSLTLANNITLGGQLIFGFGQIIDNLVNGFLRVTGGLNVVGSVSISNSLNASSINSTGSAYFATSSGSVGIGTTTPGQALHVIGSTNISATLNAPVVNTTLATQNITISSAAGSVIIRLG